LINFPCLFGPKEEVIVSAEEMKRRILGYTLCLLFCIADFLLASCASPRFAVQDKAHLSKKIPKKSPVKIHELSPDQCPWFKTFVVKHGPKIKGYGPRYAKRENNHLKDVPTGV
jgi:hypothetical protein